MTHMAVLAQATSHIRLATWVVNDRARVAGLLAMAPANTSRMAPLVDLRSGDLF